MDPNANISEQIELARSLRELLDDVDFSIYDDAVQGLAHNADRLIELIEALHTWRTEGGFDPYIEASDVIDALYEQNYKPKMEALLGRIREACVEAGLPADEPFDMSGDDYRWSMRVWRSQEQKDAGDDEHSIDVSIEIAESREYDGEQEYGVNFGLDIVESGGRILGGLTPFNYTEQCWVDARNTDAVSDRWKILEDADPNGVPDLIKEDR